ncbi:DUF3168 domain-containing protein (plasmid) [Staphylococcus aureus]|uniref:DUF3168 domain-containing protein n=1 Tax=Staphylococcus aureus TaxID=1280 RepID=UPI0021CFC96C|nr:DUF3168 domain-containing protein [Staphylococcus aureus]UXV49022.1 DUF3168 domain-containing protein [Staphylococcus aureus]UXV54395.1 DUF3168 domain-containing protein [Staphylococcus aureus]UXV57107.1 DUF3168 domain-containing protein [Staphylococcus aureus]
MDNWVPVTAELFTEVFNKLDSNPILKEKVKGGIFDYVQKDVAYPYVVIGETETTEQPTFNGMHETIAITFHVYSQATNTYEARDILRTIEMILKQGITVQGYDTKRIRKDYDTVLIDVDQFTKHGVLRMKYEIRHKTLIEGV